MDDTRETLAAAARGNVSIYGIDPRGLTSLGDQTIELGSLPSSAGDARARPRQPVASRTSCGCRRTACASCPTRPADSRPSTPTSSRPPSIASSATTARTTRWRTTRRPTRRRQVPQDRGARSAAPGSRSARARGTCVQAGRASRQECARRRCRRGSKATPELREALDSPLPVSGLTMQVFAAPFKGTAPNASVLLGVEMRGRDLRLMPATNWRSTSRQSMPRERSAPAAPTPSR